MKILILAILVAGVSCGRRIVGGKRIKYSEAPYSVAIFKNNFYFCAGSLISEDFVLSAAHCFVNHDNTDGLRIRAGSEDRSNGGVVAYVKEIFIDPEFNKTSISNDFSLLRLEENINFPPIVEFAKLPDSNTQVKAGEMMKISGWGITEHNKISQYLLGANVPIYDLEKCNKAYTNDITDAMICAGYEVGKVDSCQGDSGSGMKRLSDNVLIGVTSFGYGCGEPGYPGIYAKVSSAREWIRKIANV